MGTGPKATVQWAVSRGGGVEYQIYTLQDLQETGKFIRENPPVFFKRKEQKMYKEKCTFLFS